MAERGTRDKKASDVRGDAARFASTRAAHRDETASDYVEAIAQLGSHGREVRVTDLAKMMGVSHVTVVRIVARLRSLGLVSRTRGKPMTLTPAGEALAKWSRERHEVVLEFLKVIGVPLRQAEIDAEGIEHHVSEATVLAMRAEIARQSSEGVRRR